VLSEVPLLHYVYHDLRVHNRTLGRMACLVGLVCTVSIGHAASVLAVLSSQAPEVLITHLPASIQQTLMWDDRLRKLQLALTLMFGSYLLWWLFLAFINVNVLEGTTERNLKKSASVAGGVLLGLLSSLKMIRKLWQHSKPLNPERRLMGRLNPEEGRWVLPMWWVLLMTANITKVTAVYDWLHAHSVAELKTSYVWILAAYSLYLLFYYFSYRLMVWIANVQTMNYQILTRQPLH
jgi:hypothetical protein